ncbi:hypothetical protein EH228_16780 [Erwinia endophytica]|nr:hypothetical protein EH228_16780 [Erwinia endophytica]
MKGIFFCLSWASDSGVWGVYRRRPVTSCSACFIGYFSCCIVAFAVFFRNQRWGEKLPLRGQAALVSIHTRF